MSNNIIFIIILASTFLMAVIVGLIYDQYITIMKEKYNIEDSVDGWFYFWITLFWPLTIPIWIISHFTNYIGESLANKVGPKIQLDEAYKKELEEYKKDKENENNI